MLTLRLESMLVASSKDLVEQAYLFFIDFSIYDEEEYLFIAIN